MLGRPKVELPVLNRHPRVLEMGKVVGGVHGHVENRRLIVVEFLSDEWYVAANSAHEGLDVGNVNIVVAHVSELQSHYIVVDGGTASVEREAHHADVTLRQTSDIAEAIREGSLSALTAIQEGLIGVEGDIGCLMAAKPALDAVDRALSSLTT